MEHLMNRKNLVICAALVALGALAIAPSMASAAATLQDTSGGLTTKVAVGSKVILDTDPGTVALTEGAFGKFECNENVLTAEVVKNEPNGEARLTITAGYFQSDLNASGTDCKSTLGEVVITTPALTNFGGTNHWCIRTIPGKDEWELWGNGCTTEPGSGELTFVDDFTSGMTCSYKRAGAIKGSYTTTAGTHGPATFTLEGEPEFKTDTSSSIFCPASWKWKVVKFNLYTDTSTEPNGWTIPFTTGETADPVFVNPVE
jgi:hypothetical protein